MNGGVVRVLPLDVHLDVEPHEAVMAAAQRHGYYWPTVCGGRGECSTCWVEVTAGLEHCHPACVGETETLARCLQTGRQHVRLACQLRIDGPVIVCRRGVRKLAG